MTLARPLCLLGLGVLAACSRTPSSQDSLSIGVNSRATNAFICLVEKGSKGKSKRWKSVLLDRTERGLRDLADRKIDVAISAPPTFFKYAIQHPEQAQDFRIIAGINNIQNTFAVVSPKRSGIRVVKDIRSRKLGHLGDIVDFFKTYFFLTEGINETSIQQTTFANYDSLMKALESGTVDAAIVSDEISRRLDANRYTIFYSSVHEITSQVIVRRELIEREADTLSDFLEALISTEKELYLDLNEGLAKLKTCFPDSHEEILKELLQRRELRVLVDESLRAQYNLYKKWIMARGEYRPQMAEIRKFNVTDYIDASLLRNVDYRRVLLK